MLGFMHHLMEQRKLIMRGTGLVLRMSEERAWFRVLGEQRLQRSP